MSDNPAKYGHMLRAVYERPWAIVEKALHELVASLNLAATGQIGREEFEAAVRPPRRNGGPVVVNVARVPIQGVISQGHGLLGLLLGGTTVDQVTAEFTAALDNPQIDAVVLDVNSPGGTVDGVEELAALIRSSRGRKPIVAVANGAAQSAAYWLASQADELVVAPSGAVGSIGIYTAHHDISAAAEMEGVKTTLVSYGKYKTEGNPWEPLGDEARAEIQRQVDEFGHMFEAAVARGRGIPVETVRSGFGQGRSVLAKQALAAGMVDRIDTLDNTIRRVARGVIAQPAVAATSAGLDSDLPFSERLSLVSADARVLVEHATERADMRTKQGRVLSSRDRSGLLAVADSLRALAETETEEEDDEPVVAPNRRTHAAIQIQLAQAEHNFTIERT